MRDHQVVEIEQHA